MVADVKIGCVFVEVGNLFWFTKRFVLVPNVVYAGLLLGTLLQIYGLRYAHTSSFWLVKKTSILIQHMPCMNHRIFCCTTTYATIPLGIKRYPCNDKESIFILFKNFSLHNWHSVWFAFHSTWLLMITNGFGVLNQFDLFSPDFHTVKPRGRWTMY